MISGYMVECSHYIILRPLYHRITLYRPRVTIFLLITSFTNLQKVDIHQRTPEAVDFIID